MESPQPAGVPPRLAHRLADIGTGAPLQRRIAVTDASELTSWDGTAIDGTSAELADLIEELEDSFDWNPSEIARLGQFAAAPAVYRFADFDHLNDYIGNTSTTPPEVEEDEGAAEALHGIAHEFGATFKGPQIPFSGSVVYAVGRPGPVPGIWATRNSATGYLTKKSQNVVKTWKLPDPLQVLLDNVAFPSNTKKALDGANLKRPDVMGANAHAEVNQYVQLAILAAAHGLSPQDVGLQIASDIAHCAECFWALHALAAKGTGKFFSFTGCENRIFARWRQPWSGFYASYGDNPFRNADGTFKQNVLTKKPFATGQYSAQELNAVSTFKIYT
jgi:hypothetical protein